MTTVRVVRAQDLLVCELELLGIDVVGSAPHRTLVPVVGATQSIVLHLPAQHVAEQVFDEQEPPRERILVDSRSAGPSRAAFRVDPAHLPVDFTLASVLGLLDRSGLVVPASAAHRQQPTGCLGIAALLWYLLSPPSLTDPGPGETAIELPFRLVLSPEEDAGFGHSTVPVAAAAGRTELWHSTLRPTPHSPQQAQVRAIWLRQGEGPPWSPTQPPWSGPLGDDEPFPRVTMDQRHRSDIVHISGNRRYALQTGTAYDAEAVDVRRMALTSLGAWFDAHGDWEPPGITTTIGWTHRANQGRDNFVRVVEQGFLYPFGHLASLIHVSERKFVPREAGEGPHDGDPPLLLHRSFIVVRRPHKSFDPPTAPAGHAHVMPFREVHLHTLVTPPLTGSGEYFLVTPVGSARPLDFALTAVDAGKHSLDLTTPMVWIASARAWDPDIIKKAAQLYGSPPLGAHGVPVAFAPGVADDTTDTTYTTDTIAFAAPPLDPMPDPAVRGSQPGFWPELAVADVRAPALQVIAGAGGATRISYHPTYRTHGLGGANLNEVFAQVVTGAPRIAVDLDGRGERSGGLVKPSLSVAGLSRRLGPVGGDAGGVADLAVGKFDPSAFFSGALKSPKLFGVFELQQVLGIITGNLPENVPRMATERDGDRLLARLVWHPVPVSYPKNDSVFVVTNNTSMTVDGTFDCRSDSPQSEVSAKIERFELHLLGNPTFLELHFDKVEFRAETGRKPEIDVALADVVFSGPLSFVEELKSLIPLDGFSDPPAIDVTPQGIRSSFSLSLPDLAVGVFALQNVSLGAGFAIPFVDGALTVNFAFCKREEPFLLTVSLFGGGGFFGLTIDPAGVQSLEAAIEFGASCAINLGVAQGGVHVMAGIYFKIESAKGCTLTGYLRIGGNLSVLGLISVSIELNLSFTYKDVGKAYGRAVVTVEVDVFLFSTSVEVECERQFAGSANDPPFEDLVSPSDWRDYCAAYG